MRNSVGKILILLKENGGFNNFNHWDNAQKATYIRAKFNCSKKLAEKVARYI